MRLTIALAALCISACSIATDALRASAGSAICRLGFCRFDQIFSGIDASGMTVASVGELLLQDPRNPYDWCVFGDTLANQSEPARATAAFDRAVELGPHMPPALMRAANYYFTHREVNKALALSSAVLTGTDAFDQILFSYFRLLRLPASQLLGGAVPELSRPAKSYLDWVRANASDADLVETWTWMKRKGLLDAASAAGALWTLWYRRSFVTAHRLWLDSGTAAAPGGRELLSNPGFGEASLGGPFDWTIEAAPAVSVTRRDGLELRFAGAENVAYSGVHQAVFLKPGTYLFTAEVESQGLTTDQTPFFHLFDPVRPEAVQARSAQIAGTTPRSRVSIRFEVPSGTEAMVVQLERQPSARFDNKIRGALHVYDVSVTVSNP